MKITYIYAHCFLFMFLYSCQDDEKTLTDENEKSEAVFLDFNAPALVEARHWYESNQNQIKTRANSNHPLFRQAIPDWMACFSGENEKYRTIEINLGVQGYRRMVTEESRALYLETGNCSYLQVLTRLVILTAKEDDYVRAFYMTIVPSRKYLELTDFKPFIHNGYFRRDSRFDGLILYHEIDGTFINGWEYEDGKIWYAIQDMADSEVMTRSSGKCLMTYEVTCTDWYYTVNGGDPVYNGTTCGNPVFVKMVCGAGSPNLSELSNIKGGGGVIGNQMQDTITNTNTFFSETFYGLTQDYQDVITSILNALGQDSMSQIMSRVSYQIMESPNGNFAEVEAGTLFNALYNQDGEIIVRVPPNLEGVRLMIIMAHEFYHLYLFNITRTTLPNQLHLVNFKLNEFLNTSSTVNDGHHNYMGYSSNVYELFLRSAFPGQDNDFYTKGKWGGIV